MNDDEGWRPLSDAERAIVELICRLPANDALRHIDDLDSYEVRQAPWCVGHCPTIEFRTSLRRQSSLVGPMAGVANGVNKADGMPFDVTLFEREGQLSSLEFTPFGDLPLAYVPSTQELSVWEP